MLNVHIDISHNCETDEMSVNIKATNGPTGTCEKEIEFFMALKVVIEYLSGKQLEQIEHFMEAVKTH